MPPNILIWPSAMQQNETACTLPGAKRIVVFFGMTASGKSTLGEAWARACRAVYYNTDRVRKELAGLEPTDRCPDQLDKGIYSNAFTEKTYQALLDRASLDIARGSRMVVLDGSYSRFRDRDRVRILAKEVNARCLFIFCVCPDDEVQRRLALRTQDPTAVSDGRWEIYLNQKKTFEMPLCSEEKECLKLNTEQSVEAILAELAQHPLLRGCIRH